MNDTQLAQLSALTHPDKPGGSREAMAEQHVAQEAALLEVFR